MTQRNPDLEAKLPFYALGTLSETEMKEIDEYIKQFPDAAEELATFQEVADHLPMTVPEREPPTRLKQNLLAHAKAHPKEMERQEVQAPSPTLFERWQAWWLNLNRGPAMPIAFALSLVAISFLTMQLLNAQGEVGNLQAENSQLKSELEAVSVELAETSEEVISLMAQNQALLAQLQTNDELIAFSGDSSSLRVEIPGTEAQPNASASLFIRPETNEVLLVISELAPLSAEQIYQLWLIDGQPISAGLVELTPDGTGIFKVDLTTVTADFAAVGISIEPAGGSEQPTGDIVLYSDI